MDNFRDEQGNSFSRILKILSKNLPFILEEATTRSTENIERSLKPEYPRRSPDVDLMRQASRISIGDVELQGLESCFDISDEPEERARLPNRAKVELVLNK